MKNFEFSVKADANQSVEKNTNHESVEDIDLVLSAYLVTNDLIFSTSKK